MRYYNGCPDSDLQRLLDSRQAAKDRLQVACPQATCVYFPMEEKYLVFRDLQQIGQFHYDVIVACDEAIHLLTSNGEGSTCV